MTKELINKLTDILTHNGAHGNLYDFICNHYYELSKEELKDLTKEAIALLYDYAELENHKKGNESSDFAKLHSDYMENLTSWTDLLSEEE